MSELDTKRKEVRMAEEVITTLNARARELEDKIIESKERLRTAEELAARHFQDNNYCQTDSPGWPSSYMPFNHSANKFTTMELENGRIGPESGNSHRSPAVLSLGSLPAFRATAAESREPHSMLFDDAAPSHHTSQSLSASAFAPFDVQTPSSAYIPSSLISVLDSPSEEWSGGYIGESGTLSSSPVSFNGQAPESAVDLDLYEVGHRGQLSLGRSIYDQMGQPYRTNSDPTIPSDNPQVDTVSSTAESAPRRWFSISGREKPRKGLNPDAKVFRLPKRKLQTSGAATDTDMVNYSTLTSYDALNPTSLMTSIAPSTPSSLLRAFAPSRAEREALQRALSGSTNTSLELLPSLSDVGSIPPSPMHEHAQTEPQTTEKERLLPAWLQSLPLIRKPNFSPWEDEDTAPAEAKGV
ncbi:hypothetical protein ID866_9534 [Astraeus odoratus]|nr:hypothetical protein ID866_9534 [Astraeus odoratus]